MTARVIVVGAGLAGLAAATRLRARGVEVQVIERTERVGGRATSDRREGFAFDSGAQLVSARDANLGSLLVAGGLAATHLPLRPVGAELAHRGALEPADTGNLRGLARIPGLGLASLLRLARLERIRERFAAILQPDSPELGERLDDRSVADFVRLYFGRPVLERLAEPYLGDWQAEPAQTSRLLALLALEKREHVMLGTLRGTLADLAERLAAPLDLALGTRVEALGEGGERLELALASAAGERSVEADAVVLATPAAAALRIAKPLLTPLELDVLGSARTAPCITVHLALETPATLWTTRVRVPAVEGGPLAAVQLEPSNVPGRVPEKHGSASLLARADWSRAHQDDADDAAEAALVAAFEQLIPRAARSVRFALIRRQPAAHPLFPVGRFRAIAQLRRVGAAQRARGRRLYLAGDHLVLPTLDGAVRSGVLAADAALGDLGV